MLVQLRRPSGVLFLRAMFVRVLIVVLVLMDRCELRITKYHVRTSSEVRVYGHCNSSGCVVPVVKKKDYSLQQSQCDRASVHDCSVAARYGSKPPVEYGPVHHPSGPD